MCTLHILIMPLGGFSDTFLIYCQPLNQATVRLTEANRAPSNWRTSILYHMCHKKEGREWTGWNEKEQHKKNCEKVCTSETNNTKKGKRVENKGFERKMNQWLTLSWPIEALCCWIYVQSPKSFNVNRTFIMYTVNILQSLQQRCYSFWLSLIFSLPSFLSLSLTYTHSRFLYIPWKTFIFHVNIIQRSIQWDWYFSSTQ